LVIFSVASRDSLKDSDLQLFIETEQDQTRHMFIQYLVGWLNSSPAEIKINKDTIFKKTDWAFAWAGVNSLWPL